MVMYLLSMREWLRLLPGEQPRVKHVLFGTSMPLFAALQRIKRHQAWYKSEYKGAALEYTLLGVQELSRELILDDDLEDFGVEFVEKLEVGDE